MISSPASSSPRISSPASLSPTISSPASSSPTRSPARLPADRASPPKHPSSPPPSMLADGLPLFPTPPPSTPPKAKRYPNSILYAIRDFLQSDAYLDPSAELCFNLDETTDAAFLRELANPKVLSGKSVDSLRYDYSSSPPVLKIKSMPTPLHDSISRFASWLLNFGFRTSFLSNDEAECIELDSGGDVALPAMRRIPRSKHGKGGIGGTAIKQPDAAYFFVDNVTGKQAWFPRVVFEVAFSQRWESVVEDANGWLMRSGGLVQVVVLINLEEGKTVENHNPLQTASSPERPPDHHPEKTTVPEDDPNSPASSATSTPSPASSTPEDYETHCESEVTAQLVGPISGFLELHRYNYTDGTVYRDGPRYNIFPPPDQKTPLPKLKITDLLPATHISGDPKREYEIPLEKCRTFLDRGVIRLATNRWARNRNKQTSAGRKRARSESADGDVPAQDLTGLDENDEGVRRSERLRVRVDVAGAGVT